MRKRLVLAVVAMSLLLITSVDAQADLDQAREDVAAATERLEGFLEDLEATQRRGDELAGTYWQVQSGLEKLDLDLAATEAQAAELAAEIDDLRVQVKEIAVDQYVSRSEDVAVADHASEADRAAAEALARLMVGTDNSAIDALAAVEAEHERARSTLTAQREEQAAVLADVEATQASIVEELERLSRLRAALDTELAVLEDALADLEAAEAQRQAEAAEAARIADERRRAEEAAAAAAELARRIPTPAPTPIATATPIPTATSVPNPQLPDPTATSVPNPQLPDPTATSVPNPQLPDATPTPIPNPQPSEPFPTTTAVPNPQPSEPLPEPTAVPNPQPSIPSGGGIVCPLAGPFTHTDDFNAPRAVGGIHRANDLISAQGTPVLAAASGTVEHRDSRVGGLSAHLKADNGDYYFYTHLSGYENVGAGYVTAGTVIGYVGMTGNAPIPHLHFEIHKGGYGNYTNPYGPVRSACF